MVSSRLINLLVTAKIKDNPQNQLTMTKIIKGPLLKPQEVILHPLNLLDNSLLLPPELYRISMGPQAMVPILKGLLRAHQINLRRLGVVDSLSYLLKMIIMDSHLIMVKTDPLILITSRHRLGPQEACRILVDPQVTLLEMDNPLILLTTDNGRQRAIMVNGRPLLRRKTDNPPARLPPIIMTSPPPPHPPHPHLTPHHQTRTGLHRLLLIKINPPRIMDSLHHQALNQRQKELLITLKVVWIKLQ